jgi:hypothetical protein
MSKGISSDGYLLVIFQYEMKDRLQQAGTLLLMLVG